VSVERRADMNSTAWTIFGIIGVVVVVLWIIRAI
jgi:hypothetical protein